MKLIKAADIIEREQKRRSAIMNILRSTERSLKTEQPSGADQPGDPERTRVVGNFPDGNSALMLVAARLRHIASTKWGNPEVYVHGTTLYHGTGQGSGTPPSRL
jgi:hypothetical protein